MPGSACFAALRGILHYGEQACNHFIAFKLLALIRDKVFRALRWLCPAKLEGKDKGNLISVITSDIELLEVFYAHTISPVAIAVLMSLAMSLLIGRYHWTLGLLAAAAYVTVGAVIPLVTSKRSGDNGAPGNQIYRGGCPACDLFLRPGNRSVGYFGNIPEHAVVGITEKSGSGKSTLLKLLMRFWEVQEGQVFLSGTDIGRINTANLRDIENFMTQDTQLFHDSIANNLRIAKRNATRKKIEAACQKASVHDFIMGLPQGYDTPVGELGGTLSGGERQRIGLARAFLHDAPFLLLDEPASNLDSLNEAMILKSLGEERKGKTVVLVSHRPSTIRMADRVYSVEHGRMS